MVYSVAPGNQMEKKKPFTVLILRHPQEPGVDLGSAPIVQEVLAQYPQVNCVLRTGLSWPNLKKALGVETDLNNKRWLVVYLGSGIKGAETRLEPGMYFVSKKGTLLDETFGFDGIVLLDGTWSQAKTLWWRNAWLLKLQRVVLIPSQVSLYGKKRKEPRKECVSTLEACAQVLKQMPLPQDLTESIPTKLIERFSGFLENL